jgi:hypothetical protein
VAPVADLVEDVVRGQDVDPEVHRNAVAIADAGRVRLLKSGPLRVVAEVGDGEPAGDPARAHGMIQCCGHDEHRLPDGRRTSPAQGQPGNSPTQALEGDPGQRHGLPGRQDVQAQQREVLITVLGSRSARWR